MEEKGKAAIDPADFSEEEYKKQIESEQDNTAIETSFPAPCFSTFSVTWPRTYNGNQKVTVHYGYMDGNTFHEFDQQPAPAPTNGFGGATEAYLTYDFDGWQAKNEVYYHSSETNNPKSGGTRIQNTLYKGYASGNWLYNGYGGNNDMPRDTVGLLGVYPIPGVPSRATIATNILENNSHIYVLYEQKPEATQGGAPVPTNEGVEKPTDPSITKTSDVNHDGTNTIHLTVEGHTSP